MSRQNRAFQLAIAAVAGLPLSQATHAAVIGWSNPAGGLANVGANWTGGVVPGAADTAAFSLAGPYTVTFPAGFPATATWSGVAGTVAWTLTSPQATGSVRVATDTVNTPVVTISGNTLTASAAGGAVALGVIAGTGSGTLNIQAGAIVRTTAVNGDIVAGVAGNGFLNVGSGGRAEAADDVIVANNVGSTGQASVEGTGSTIATTSATTGDVVIALNGTGTLNVTGFGSVSAAHDLAVAVNPGSIGTVNVSDNDFPGSINVANNCDIGRNVSAGSAGGTGLLALSGPAAVSVTVNQSTTVGDPDGGLGTLRLDGGTFTTRALAFDPVNSALIFNNGLLVVNGGVFTPRPGQLTLEGAAPGNLPTLRLSNGATCIASGGFLVGGSRSARMEVLSGSTATGNAGAISIGAAPGGTGSILVDGTGSSVNQALSTIHVGFGGNGTLLVQNGGRANCAAGRIANNVGSTGSATITGAGSRWDLGSILAIGGSAAASGGVGSCTFENGAVGVASHLILWPGSTFNLNNASFTAFAEATLDGVTTITNGTLVASELLESGTTNITASGRMDMRVDNGSVFTSRIALNGPLDIGPSVAGSGFNWAAALEVGAHALSIRDLQGVGFQFSRIGDVTINGGSVTPVSPNRGTDLANGDSLIGTGTINGNMQISPGATVTATGTSGLTFNGIVTAFPPNLGITLSGSRVNFGSSGGLTAFGTVNAVCVASPGAVITATGNLSLGTASPVGFGLVGARLNVGAHILTLVDSNGGTVGEAHLDGGTIVLSGATSPDNNLNTAQGGHLSGHGQITAPRFRNIGGTGVAGQVSPGEAGDATGVGAITIGGDYHQVLPGNTPGILNMDLAGPGGGEFDYLRVGGGAILGGTLNVSLIAGYAPQPGDFHTIITTDSGSISGDFSVKNLPPGFISIISENTYSVGLPCPADYNADGNVDPDDLGDFINCYFDTPPCPNADFNNDGNIDPDDLGDFINVFFAGC